MLLRTTLLLLAAFFYTSPALAAWGENWGEMVWGAAAPAAVPSIDGIGLGLLALVLIGLAIRGLRSRATLGLMVLASFVGAADLAEAQVTIPNTFTNGEVADAGEVNANFSALANALDVTVPSSFANSGIADANQVNSNFDVLKTAVDTFTNDLAAATSATETAFTNGSIQGVASVDITTDNAAVCTTAGGTYDAGTDSCSVDITTDNAAAEAVAAAAARSAACTQAGGSFFQASTTCTPPYDCFIGGFCSEVAIAFPPATYGYTNTYDGHSPGSVPASLAAGCAEPSLEADPLQVKRWDDGADFAILSLSTGIFGAGQIGPGWAGCE